MAFAPDGLTSVGGFPGTDEKGAELFRKVDGKEDDRGFCRCGEVAQDTTGQHGQARGGRILLRRRHRQSAWRCGLGKDLNAGVAFYGRQAGADDVPKIHAPLMLHYAGNDAAVSTRDRRHMKPP